MQTHDNPATIRAWTWYDWANSVYPLIITAAIFPIYYESVTQAATGGIVNVLGIPLRNTSLYTYALSLAYLSIAMISPLLSGVADYTGRKKPFMKFFCYLGASACALMWFFKAETLWLGILMMILACIGYSGSLVFYNAYLPEIASPEQQDRVSARGFAMGYVGSVILLSLTLGLILKPALFGGIAKGDATRLAFVMVGAWWAGFAQIAFRGLPEGLKDAPGSKDRRQIMAHGYQELRKVWGQLRHQPVLKRYLGAYFVYTMGLQTVLLVATLFGKKEIHLESGQLILTVMILQFVGIAGAYLFAYASRRIGNLLTLQLATLVWMCICLIAYFISSPMQFFMLAGGVGLVMGGTQALSRSTYSKLLPETRDHASYFSFYDVCEKLAIVVGTATFGILEQITHSMRYSVLMLVFVFIAGFALVRRVAKSEREAGPVAPLEGA